MSKLRKSGKKRPVSNRHQAFVDQYMIDRNATAAYQRAGYLATGMSAAASASGLLKRPNIKALVRAAEKEIAKKTRVTVERIEREFAIVAFSDMSEYAEWGPYGVRVKSSGTIQADNKRAVKEISDSKGEHGTSTSLKLHNKIEALKQLALRHGFYEKPKAGKTKQGISQETADEIRRKILGLGKNDKRKP